jgi:hypothetical protein
MDCSDIVTTPAPPPHLSTKPPDVSPTPVSASGLTPSNTYIRKPILYFSSSQITIKVKPITSVSHNIFLSYRVEEII